MDLMDDEDLKHSVIDQMMGELDDVASDSLKKKPEGAPKGVEIAITVTPKTGDEMEEDADGDMDGDDAACMDEKCEDPTHDHAARDGAKGEESENYISQLLKKLG